MTTGLAAHGKDFGLKIATKQYALYLKTHTWEITPGIHDMSGSGTDDMSFRGGQIQRTITVGGWTDDDTTNGPRGLQALAGTTVAFERWPDGAGTGKAKQTGNVVVGKYNETAKNDDIFQWTVDLQVTGAVTTGVQS